MINFRISVCNEYYILIDKKISNKLSIYKINVFHLNLTSVALALIEQQFRSSRQGPRSDCLVHHYPAYIRANAGHMPLTMGERWGHCAVVPTPVNRKISKVRTQVQKKD